MPIALKGGGLLTTTYGNFLKKKADGGAPTMVFLQGGTLTVGSWMGNHLARLSSDQPGVKFELVEGGDKFEVSGPILRQKMVHCGAIGDTHRVKIRARSPYGVTAPFTFDLPVVPYVVSPANCIDYFDYDDPSTLVYDGSNRLRKATGKLRGTIREQHSGYAAAASSRSPTVLPGEGIRFTRASQQYLKLAADSVNNPVRALFRTQMAEFSHVVILTPKSTVASQGLGAMKWADGTTRTGWRVESPTSLSALIGDDDTPATLAAGVQFQEGFATDTPTMIGIMSSGTRIYFYQDGKVLHQDSGGDGIAVATAQRGTQDNVTDFWLGCFGTGYLDAVVRKEYIFNEGIDPAELRALILSHPEWGIDYVWPEMLDFSKFEDPMYFDDCDDFKLADYETFFNRPNGSWLWGAGGVKTHIDDVTGGLYSGSVNDEETSLMVPPDFPGAQESGLDTLEIIDGTILRQSVQSMASLSLTPGLADFVWRMNNPMDDEGVRHPRKVQYTHFGTLMHTRRVVAPMYSLSGVLSKDPKPGPGQFPCSHWDLDEPGGHPPETDNSETAGDRYETSAGVHQNNGHPFFPTRQSYGGTIKAPDVWRHKGYHWYHMVKDRESDELAFFVDGYLFHRLIRQKGIRVSSAKAQLALWASGSGRGEGIKASNGTLNGTLSLQVAGGGREGAKQSTAMAKLLATIVNGRITDANWGDGSDGATRGAYTDDPTPLRFVANGGGALVATVQPTCVLEVGVNDPRYLRGFDSTMFMITNASSGAFTGTYTGTKYDMYCDAFEARAPKRAPISITTPAQAAADAHCVNLFAAMASVNGGVGPDTTDQNIVNAIIGKLDSTIRRWDIAPDGMEKSWNYPDTVFNDTVAHPELPQLDKTKFPNLWAMMPMLGVFAGPNANFAKVDWKDPNNRFVPQGGTDWAGSAGYGTGGVVGKHVRCGKSMATMAAATDMVRPYDMSLMFHLSQGPAPTQVLAPYIGAGSDLRFSLAGSNFYKGFDPWLGVLGANTIAAELQQLALPPGFYTLCRRESKLYLFKDGNLKLPYWAGYMTGRAVEHAAAAPLPTAELLLGTNSATVAGPVVSTALLGISAWQTNEANKAYMEIFAPWFERYGVVTP